MTHIQSLSQDKNEKNTTWLFSGMWNKFVSLLSVLSHTFSFLLSLCVCLRQPILPFSLFVCLSLILNPSFPPCVCVCVSLCLSVCLSISLNTHLAEILVVKDTQSSTSVMGLVSVTSSHLAGLGSSVDRNTICYTGS